MMLAVVLIAGGFFGAGLALGWWLANPSDLD